MRKGNILIPVVIAFFSIAAFLGMLYYALPVEKKVAVNGNTTVAVQDNANTNSSVNTNVTTNASPSGAKGDNIENTNTDAITARNTNVTVDLTINWKTYTNTKYGYSFKYPEDWVLSENTVTIGQTKFDGVQAVSVEKSDSFTVTAIPFYRGQTDPAEQFLMYGFTPPSATVLSTKIAGIYGTEYSTTNGTPTITAFIDHESTAFKLDQGSNRKTWDLISRTFSFTDGNTDLEKTNPIKTITNIAQTLNIYGSAVSVMGGEALIGSFFSTTTSGHLYQYDGKQAIDISSNITASDPDDANRPYGVGSVVNNGQYWLVSVCRYNGGNYLFKYDGTTWTNLTSYVRAAQKKAGCFGPSMTWNGTDWLFTYNLQLIKYDGNTTFSDVPLSPEFSQQFMVFGATWNGSYYLIPTNGTTWKTFKYDGQTFTALPIPADNHVSSAGWNGTYWLLSGFSNQPILKYDGLNITTSGDSTYQQAGSKWLKSIWIVGPYFFDGTKLDATTPFTVSYRVDGISLGEHYGLMAGGSRLWRFDY